MSLLAARFESTVRPGGKHDPEPLKPENLQPATRNLKPET
jgi:hypothetical protein